MVCFSIIDPEFALAYFQPWMNEQQETSTVEENESNENPSIENDGDNEDESNEIAEFSKENGN